MSSVVVPASLEAVYAVCEPVACFLARWSDVVKRVPGPVLGPAWSESLLGNATGSYEPPLSPSRLLVWRHLSTACISNLSHICCRASKESSEAPSRLRCPARSLESFQGLHTTCLAVAAALRHELWYNPPGSRDRAMNINALLSPSESPATPSDGTPSVASPTPPRTARPAGGKRTTSGLSQELRQSPENDTSTATSRPSSAYHSPSKSQRAFYRQSAVVPAVPNFRPVQQSPTSNPNSALNSPVYHGGQAAQQRPVVSPRVSSTPQMETLAGTSPNCLA